MNALFGYLFIMFLLTKISSQCVVVLQKQQTDLEHLQNYLTGQLLDLDPKTDVCQNWWKGE